MSKTENITLSTPSKWDWVQAELNSYIVQKNYEDIDPAEAFVKKRIGTLSGDIYRMYINSNRPEDLQKYLECHEAGHIIFGHITNEDTKDKINKFKIQAAWPKVKDRFNDEKQWERQFDSILYNIVEDMEVNSKMFTPEEWVPFSETIGGGIWPEDYGFPCGLDYNTYLNLVLKDPSQFLDKLEDEMKNNQSENSGEGNGKGSGNSLETKDKGEEKEQESESSGNGEKSDKKENSKGSGVSEINNSDFENAEFGTETNGASSDDKQVRVGDKLSDEVLQKLQEYFDKNDEEATDKILESISPEHDGSNGSSPVGGEAVEIDLSEKSSFESMAKDLEKLLVKNITKSSRDILYNYNRNKHNSNIIIPRVSSRERTTKACLYVLLDISGSISSYAISNFCTAFQKTAKKLNKKSRIILWNTALVKDYSMSDEIKAYGRGGTDMASGMKYIKEEYHPGKDDVFFLVSDFQDDLHEWNKELAELDCNKYAFIFSENSDEESCNSDYLHIENYINEANLSKVKELWKNTKAIDIVRE